MKVTIFVLMLVGAVAVNAQDSDRDRRGRSIDDRKEQKRACKYGKPIVGECNGEEYTIAFESDYCPTRERTGKCMVNSEGKMVPVASVFRSLECFYTLPDMSGACDPETKALVLSQTLLTKDVQGCDETIQSTVQCKENKRGKLIPKPGQIRRSFFPRRPKVDYINSEKAEGIPQRQGRRFKGKNSGGRNSDEGLIGRQLNERNGAGKRRDKGNRRNIGDGRRVRGGRNNE